MRKLIVPFLVGVLIVSILMSPKQLTYAQGLSFPAEINKSFTPISIPAGGISRLMVTIYNPNAFALTDATWTDNLVGVQPGLLIASPVNLSNSCGGTATAIAGATTLSLSGGVVPAQAGVTPGSCTVAIDVTATIPGNLINTLPADALTSLGAGDIITNTSPASATLNVVGVQPPTVNKSFSSSTIWAGEIVQLSIVIRNNAPTVTLTQVSLTDTLPDNVFLADPVSPTLAGCGTSASLSAPSGGTSVRLSDATIAPNSTCTIRVNVTSDTQGSFVNTIPANALETQQGLTNRSPDSAQLNVQVIGATKTFSPPSIPAGATSTVTITLQNPTGSPYTGVNVTDILPGTVLTVVPGSAATTCGGTVSITPPRTVNMTGGTIPAGTAASPGTCTFTFQVTAPLGAPSDTYVNVIPPGGITNDQGVGNGRPITATLTVTGADMLGIKSFSPSNIAAGGNSRLRIEITAPGDTDLTNFSIVDNLPAGLTISNSTPPETSDCGAAPPLLLTATTGAASISLTNGLILSGQRCRIDVYVTGSTAGIYDNVIPPANITNNENRAPSDDLTATLRVGDLGNLSIAVVKGFDPLTVFGNSVSKMSILLINPNSNVGLTGITFTDNMPSGMILATPLNFNVGTCGGTLSGDSGAHSFSFSGGSLPAGTRCTLTLSVTMTVNGNLTNTIPANTVTTLEGANNPDPAEASLTNLPGAGVSKYFSSNPIVAGSYSLLTITIQNTGNVALSGMGLKDTLPAGLVIANPPGPAAVNTCGGTLSAVAGTQIIQLTNGSLDASAACTMVIAVTGSTPGDYKNTIPPGTLISDQGSTNHEPATDTLVITDGQVDEGGGGGGGGSNTVAANNFLIPVTGFAPGRVSERSVASSSAYDATSLTLEIPVIKVKTTIVGVEHKNGNWDVSWLQNQVGWLNGTAYPTWKGNSVLTGHVVGADGNPSVFSGLKHLGVGEYIFIYISGYRYTYQAVSNTSVQPNDASVMKHEEMSYLTLITCDDYDVKTGTYLRRVVARAVLVDVSLVK